MSADLEFALSLADDADAIALARFGAADLKVETKPDLTPVSEADRAVEERIRERVAVERPGERVLGEEFGEDGGVGARWIIDPIDGTRNYTRGIPVWATLIALEDRVAVASAPALGRRWWATRGGGAFCNGERLSVSAIARVEDATLLFAFDRPLPERAFGAWHVRGFGDFWAHMLVAEGAAEMAIDAPGLALWDTASVSVIVEEAGGRFSGHVSSNSVLHAEALALAR